jgi:penicillin-binding protein 1A
MILGVTPFGGFTLHKQPYVKNLKGTSPMGGYPPASPDFEQDGQLQPGQENWDGYQQNAGPDQWDGEYTEQYLPQEYPPEDFEEQPLPEVPEKTYRHTIFKPHVRKSSFFLAVLVNAARILFLVVVLGGLCGLGAVLGIAKAYVETAPNLDLALLDDQAQTSFIYDADDNLITDYKGTENRVMVSIDQMPTHLQNAFIAVEDSRFFTHNGVDIKRIIGSLVANVTTGSNQGGSTITQQLIKQTVLSSELSYKRKIQEAYLAMQLETRYTKQQILESYLNTIFLGENYYGVQVAAEGYFGKELSQLTLRESAMLAGINSNPYYYNPRRNFYLRSAEGVDYPAITNDRTNYVLRCMYENEFITQEQYEEALSPATAAVLEKSPSEGAGMYKYAHYVEYAVKDVVNTFLKMEGLEDTSENRYAMENKLRTGGYRVKLAIDTQIQETVEETLSAWKNYPSLRDPKDKIYRARNADGTYTEIIQPQAAAVVIDYRTGELKAIVGSRDRPTQRKTLNRAADNRMPVGSAIKPLAVYAPAIEMGASPASVVYNMPLPIPGWKNSKNQDDYPDNYGGGGFKGPQTLRAAMRNSYNVSAAQTLMTMVGVDRAVDFLMKEGVNRDHIDATPFGVTLGSSGISPVEMAVAYSVLANGGVYQSPISFLGISDSNGKVIYDSHANQTRRQVFKPSTAWLVIDMMKDVVSGGTGTGAKISGQTVAGKTGTNSEQKGIGFAGITGWYASYVWIGHDNYKALSSKSTGSNSAAPLWKAYMSKIHKDKDLPNRDIMEGDPGQYGLVKVTTCGVSGQLATAACRNDVMGYGTVTDYWAAGTKPLTECQMHKTMTVCTESQKLANQYCPSVASKGVIVIPKGHPLYKYINTKYASTLEKYLGDFSTLRYTNDANANAALNSGITCDIHGPGTVNNGGDPIVNNTLLPDANRLLGQAQTVLGRIEQGTDAYNNLQNAISNLQGLVNQGNPSSSSLAQAMSVLTSAMAAAQ